MTETPTDIPDEQFPDVDAPDETQTPDTAEEVVSTEGSTVSTDEQL